MRITTSILCAITVAASAECGAQSLNKEITVERDIVPEYRDAERLRLTPAINLPAIQKKRLNYSLVDRPVGVTPAIYPLGLQTPAVSIGENYRGYAAIGYMPMFNMAASAGYRFIDTKSTKVDAWLQYNGRAYHSDILMTTWSLIPEDPGEIQEKMFRNNAVTVGASLNQSTGEKSALNAFADYSYTRYTMIECPYDETYRLFNQAVNRFNIAADWSHRDKDGISYGIDASYSRFAFISPKYDVYDSFALDNRFTMLANKENHFDFGIFGDAALGGGSYFGLDVDFSYLHNDFNTIFSEMWSSDSEQHRYLRTDGENTWLLRLTPSYRFISGDFTADLGARIDLTHGAGKAFHIAPDVKIGFRTSDYFSAQLEFGGGEVQNSLASLFDISPYMMPYFAYRNSHIPFTGDLKATIGPFSGAYIELFGGYARANEWLMPGDGDNSYTPVDLRGWHGGAAAGYRHGKLGEVRLSFEGASHSDGDKPQNGYYLWRDRAKYVIEASGRISPVDKLDITAGYTFRSGRRDFRRKLGTASLLDLGAAYRFTPRFTVFVNGENLLNRKYKYIGMVPSQGITGLAGVTYKF